MNIKKIIYMSILSSLFSLNSCDGDTGKSYAGTPEFDTIEKKLTIKEQQAIRFYDDHFTENFVGENKAEIDSYFWKVIYIYENNYYIGYIHKYDKKGPKEGEMHFLAKIDSKTGEVSVVK